MIVKKNNRKVKTLQEDRVPDGELRGVLHTPMRLLKDNEKACSLSELSEHFKCEMILKIQILNKALRKPVYDNGHNIPALVPDTGVPVMPPNVRTKQKDNTES